MTNKELISYYSNLLIIQYKSKPKATATIQALIKVIAILELLDSIEEGYQIDLAGGQPQDIIGAWLGVSRTIYGTSFTRNYFGFKLYSASPAAHLLGFMTYDETVPDEQFRNYTESSQPLYSLNDNEFRFVQKLKILINNSNFSSLDIDNLLFLFFGDNVIFNDRLNMSMSYIFASDIQRLIQIAKSENLLPRPLGVSLSVSFASDINAMFFLKEYGSSTPSWAIGFKSYSVSKSGCFLTYGA